MPRAHVNGISLYYEVAGRGTPLVLVHGFACGMRSWEPQVRALSKRFRAITYDVRGFGISEAPDVFNRAVARFLSRSLSTD